MSIPNESRKRAIANSRLTNNKTVTQYTKAGNKIKRWAFGFMTNIECPNCHGARLKKESLQFKIDNKNIAELAHLDILDLFEWSKTVEKRLTGKQKTIGKEILKEINKRIQFLLDVGLDYLTLNRSSRSLSGGE